MNSEVVDTGTVNVWLGYNVYQAGDVVTFQYRHGATEALCLAAAWQVYAGIFASDGFVQIRVEAP